MTIASAFRQDLKELRFRPNTEEHDYHVRLKNAKKFISQVLLTLDLRPWLDEELP